MGRGDPQRFSPESPSFEDGYKVQEVIDAIGRSVQTRRSVEMQRGRRSATTS